MVGIKFKIKNEYNIALKNILEDIKTENFNWKVEEDEVYNQNGKDFFEKDIYSDIEFKKLIQTTHYPVFLCLKGSSKDSKIDEINNYSQFQENSCTFILFITDNEFVEIYSKEENVLNKIIDNVYKNQYKNLKIINKTEDIQNVFSPYYD